MPRLLLGTLALVAALLGAFVIAAAALGATPVGSEFQVNTYTTDYQVYPSVSLDADGDFVVVWHSDGSAGTDTDSLSIQGQRYDSTGAAAPAASAPPGRPDRRRPAPLRRPPGPRCR